MSYPPPDSHKLRLMLMGFRPRMEVIERKCPDATDAYAKPLLPQIKKQMKTVERCRAGVNEKRRGYGARHLADACVRMNLLLTEAEADCAFAESRDAQRSRP